MPHEGNAIAWLAGALAYAAAPVFALMALASANATPSMASCPAMPGVLPFDGMTAMYLLMCLFHLRPWLKLAGTARPTSRH
ncbi:MAG: hypothetical protein EPN36_02385 [Rhodanobacteraceae bacterium]|nr:MAG: hypothetical protein EPN36_02385 [Rhodanobacteraceae bacterium]